MKAVHWFVFVMKGAKRVTLHTLTILTDIHTDGVDVGNVSHGRPHGGTGRPHVVEEENWHSGEAEHAEPGHAQDVSEEHKLRNTNHWITMKP